MKNGITALALAVFGVTAQAQTIDFEGGQAAKNALLAARQQAAPTTPDPRISRRPVLALKEATWVSSPPTAENWRYAGSHWCSQPETCKNKCDGLGAVSWRTEESHAQTVCDCYCLIGRNSRLDAQEAIIPLSGGPSRPISLRMSAAGNCAKGVVSVYQWDALGNQHRRLARLDISELRGKDWDVSLPAGPLELDGSAVTLEAYGLVTCGAALEVELLQDSTVLPGGAVRLNVPPMGIAYQAFRFSRQKL
jgi:hypothetical protein